MERHVVHAVDVRGLAQTHLLHRDGVDGLGPDLLAHGVGARHAWRVAGGILGLSFASC